MRLTLLLTFLFFELISITFAQPVLQTPPASVHKWDVYELTIQDNSTYNNPFWDVKIQGEFTGPSSEKINVKGFYYDSNLWKVRMAPTEEGTWTFKIVYFTQSVLDTLKGSFQCTAPEAGNHGFIGINPAYPHKFEYSDHTVFIPNGTAGHTPATLANYLNIWPQSIYDTLQVPVMWDTLSKYSVNTFRLMLFNQSEFEAPFSWNTYETTANFFSQSGGLDRYNTFVGKAMDRWLKQAQEHNISIYICLFTVNDNSFYPFSTSPFSQDYGGPYSTIDEMYQQTSGKGFDFEKKYVTYICSRYSAYRNIVLWEYNNEYGARTYTTWLSAMSNVIQANDPYNRPKTVSFWYSSFSRQSNLDAQNSLTVTDDHFYSQQIFNTTNADSATNEQARYRFSSYEKPVMFGEMGSEPGEDTDYWSTFQRAAYWGAFTGGGYPLFWLCGNLDDTGWLYNQRDIQFMGAVNKVVNRFNDFNTMIPGISTTVTNPSTLRIYSLANDNEALYYIHNYSNNISQTTGSTIKVSFNELGSKSYTGVWLNAATGDSVGYVQGLFTNGTARLDVPPFTSDILLYIKKRFRTGIVKEKNLPTKFDLFQNYPNPFNPTTVIKFSIPKETYVKLEVYNSLGQSIKVLMNKELNAGIYRTSFNASYLPSGIYYYRLMAGEYISIKKAVLLK